MGKIFYTVNEAAKLLHFNPQTLRKYIREGKVVHAKPSARKILISEDEIKRILATSRNHI